MPSKKCYINDNPGYVTLLSVLFLGALGLAVSLTLMTASIYTSKSSLVLSQSKGAQALADACAEEALRQIKATTSYTGSDTLTLWDGSCTYTVSNESGNVKLIQASGTVSNAIRKTRVRALVTGPNLSLNEWQELAAF